MKNITKQQIPPYVLPIVDEVDGDTVVDVIESLQEVEPGRGMRVILCSPGGSAECGIAIYDMLCHESWKRKLVTEAWGEAASVASLIFQAGTWRQMSVNSKLMIHDPGTHAEEDVKVTAGILRGALRELESVRTTVVDILADRSGQSKSRIARWMKQDKVFNAEEAVRYGLADEIVGVGKPFHGVKNG